MPSPASEGGGRREGREAREAREASPVQSGYPVHHTGSQPAGSQQGRVLLIPLPHS